MSKYASVAISGPPRRTFTYRIPADSPKLSPGQRVLVPFGRLRKLGFFLGLSQPPPDIEIKTIHRVIDHSSYFSKELFDFCLWTCNVFKHAKVKHAKVIMRKSGKHLKIEVSDDGIGFDYSAVLILSCQKSPTFDLLVYPT